MPVITTGFAWAKSSASPSVRSPDAPMHRCTDADRSHERPHLDQPGDPFWKALGDGHDVVRVSQLGLAQAADAELLRVAHE